MKLFSTVIALGFSLLCCISSFIAGATKYSYGLNPYVQCEGILPPGNNQCSLFLMVNPISNLNLPTTPEFKCNRYEVASAQNLITPVWCVNQLTGTCFDVTVSAHFDQLVGTILLCIGAGFLILVIVCCALTRHFMKPEFSNIDIVKPE